MTNFTYSERYPQTAAILETFVSQENADTWDRLDRHYKHIVFGIYLDESEDNYLNLLAQDKIKDKLIKLVETECDPIAIETAAKDFYYAIYLELLDNKGHIFDAIFDEQKEKYLNKLRASLPFCLQETEWKDCA